MKFLPLFLLTIGCYAPVDAPTASFYEHNADVMSACEKRADTDADLRALLNDYVLMIGTSTLTDEERASRYNSASKVRPWTDDEIVVLRIQIAALRAYREEATKRVENGSVVTRVEE